MRANKVFQAIGVAGTIIFVIYFAMNPSFPTPDKILIFLTFVFMAFSQAKEMLKRFFPFVLLLLVYESFRGIASQLNSRVEFQWMIDVDKWMFGSLPTTTLQNWFWAGQVSWYDFLFYFVYTLHFVLPFALAVLVWKYREKFYWQYMTTFIVVSFMGFLTFLAFPAAPPWMASDKGYIEPIAHVSSYVWQAAGITDFPSVYNKISPNPVAAVPSLHAAYATLLLLFTYRFFGKKWALLAAIYPTIIYLGTVYSGEHYAIDEILGIIYALAAYFGLDYLFKRIAAQKKSSKEQTPS